LDVNEEVERYYDAEIRHGRRYPNLDTLVHKGLVKKGKHDLRTNKYELTDRSEREIEAHLDWELSYIPDKIKSEINHSNSQS
jgi:PadR family transcriptional regulator, regulatory protein PadR